MQIKDKKGVENVVADHLSRLTIAHDTHSAPINDEFPEESLMQLEKLHGMLTLPIFSPPKKSQLNGKDRIGNISLLKSIPIIGKSPSCSSTVQIK